MVAYGINALLESPALTGSPTAPTQAAGDASTDIATDAFVAAAIAAGLARVAATPAAGFALQDATPTILSWTAPNDGLTHAVVIFFQLVVTSAETGGEVGLTATGPGGANVGAPAGFSAGSIATDGPSWTTQLRLIEANTTVSVVQETALTAGAATVFAGIWAT